MMSHERLGAAKKMMRGFDVKNPVRSSVLRAYVGFCQNLSFSFGVWGKLPLRPLLNRLLQRLSQLVGTRRRLAVAADVLDGGNHLLGTLTLDQSADALQVAVTAAHEGTIRDDMIVIQLHLNQTRAGALRHILNLFHSKNRYNWVDFAQIYAIFC